ncbi:alpha/beta fold hydrolase [Aestuariibius insulae]|uniref:alpha/beta hydrolase family protein n=1 Tax=Aestuariibius insulae TaxID=2058287 RepID=UPI00345EC581
MTRMTTIERSDGVVETTEFIPSGMNRLAGHLYRPSTPPLAAVVLNGATGVPQRYYADFAQWLVTDHQLACLTFDYSDFGESAAGPVRGSPATMTQWGLHDQQAARDHLSGLFPTTLIWVIGHSLGAMMLPMQRGLDRIDRIISVASGPVHVSDHPWPYRAVAHAFWSGPTALATRALGYMPGARIGFGADLPEGVYRQWRRWCTSRTFYACETGRELPWPDRHRPTCPLRVVAVTDDQMVPPAAVWRLMRLYPETTQSQKTLNPRDYDLPEIGHIGAFHKRAKACWPDIVGL